MAQFYEKKDDGILIRVLVQPRSAKNMVMGVHGDALKVKLTAPPVEGAANKMCIGFFAKLLGVPKSTIEITSGQASRNKTLHVPYGDKDSAQAEKARLIKILVELGK